MRALVHPGPAREAMEECTEPEITAPTEVIIKTTKTTIYNSDLRILKGDVLTCQPGRILCHEGIGVADPPVRRVASGRHRVVGFTPSFGSVLHDYLA